MMRVTADMMNGFFEGGGALLLLLNIHRLMKDKKISGISVAPVIFWTAWGWWNCYYYPHLNQWFSFAGGVGVAVMNSVWIALALYYHRKRHSIGT
jgi:hypothetical protein